MNCTLNLPVIKKVLSAILFVVIISGQGTAFSAPAGDLIRDEVPKGPDSLQIVQAGEGYVYVVKNSYPAGSVISVEFLDYPRWLEISDTSVYGIAPDRSKMYNITLAVRLSDRTDTNSILLEVIGEKATKSRELKPEEIMFMAPYSSVPEMTSNLDTAVFREKLVRILLNSPLNLRIESCKGGKIKAFEIYEGKYHRKWFFWKRGWKEKVMYEVYYYVSAGKIKYVIDIDASEAPNENYKNWRKCQPTKPTKEKEIINRL